MKVSEKVKFMRQLKNLSQEEVAEKLGMSVKGYSDIERGKTDIQMSRIEEIAKALEVDVMELLNFAEKNVYYQSGANNCYFGQNSFMNDMQCKLQLEKLQFIVEQKDKEISLLHEQIIQLKAIIELMKK